MLNISNIGHVLNDGNWYDMRIEIKRSDPRTVSWNPLKFSFKQWRTRKCDWKGVSGEGDENSREWGVLEANWYNYFKERKLSIVSIAADNNSSSKMKI